MPRFLQDSEVPKCAWWSAPIMCNIPCKRWKYAVVISCSLQGRKRRSGNSEPARAKLLASNSDTRCRIPTGCGDPFPLFGVWVLNLWIHPGISYPCPSLSHHQSFVWLLCWANKRAQKLGGGSNYNPHSGLCWHTPRRKVCATSLCQASQVFPQEQKADADKHSPRQPQKRNPCKIPYALPSASSPPPMPLLPRKVAWSDQARVKLHTPRRTAWPVHPSRDAISARNESRVQGLGKTLHLLPSFSFTCSSPASSALKRRKTLQG